MKKIGIFLDSTELYGDAYLAGPAFRLLFNALRKNLIAYVLMPGIVYDETVNHFREHLESHINNAKTGMRKISYMIKKEVRFSGEIRMDEEVRTYEALFKAQLKRENIRVLDYPKTDHQKIVAKALLRRKPFDGEGKKGYRDALIWETIKIFLSENKGVEVVLITNNSKDFNDDKGGLHEDLLQGLDEAKIPRESLRILKSLDDFNAEYLLEKLKYLEGIEKALSAGEYEGIDLGKTLSDLMESELKNGMLVEDFMGTRYSEPKIDWIERIESITIDTVRELDADEVFVRAQVKTFCELEFFINKSDYYSIADYHSIYIIEADWNDHVMYASEKMNISASISFTLTKKAPEITSFDITGIQFDSRG